MCFQKLPKLPPLLRDSGNFSNFWKHTWYSSLIFLAPMRLPITIVLNLCSEKLSAQSKKIIQILFIFHAALYRAQLRRRAFSTRYDLVHQLVLLKMRLVNPKKKSIITFCQGLFLVSRLVSEITCFLSMPSSSRVFLRWFQLTSKCFKRLQP